MNKLKIYLTIGITILATTVGSGASPRDVDLDINDQPKVEKIDPGYSLYIQHAPTSQLDSAVDTMPEFSNPNLFMSEEGLFRYAYFEKTGVWVSHHAAKKAMAETTDQGNW